jgi:hypothetical protein
VLTEWFDPMTVLVIVCIALLGGMLAAFIEDYREGK